MKTTSAHLVNFGTNLTRINMKQQKKNTRLMWLVILAVVGMFTALTEQSAWAWAFNNTYQLYRTTTTWDSVSPTIDVQYNNIFIDGANRGYFRFAAAGGQYMMFNTTRVPNPYIRDSNIAQHGFYWIFINPSSGTYGNLNNGEGYVCNYNMVIENGDRAYLSLWQGVMEWNRDNTVYALTSRCFANDGTERGAQTTWRASLYSIDAYASTLTIANGGGENFVGQITGKTRVVKNGDGWQYFTASDNNFSGGMVINGGVMVGQHDGNGYSLGAGTIQLNGGTIHNGNYTPTYSNAISITANSSLRAGWNKNMTFTGQISGGGRLEIADDGSSSLVILTNGGNNWTGGLLIGGTSINNGSGSARLQMGGNNTLGSGLVSFGSNGSFLDMNGYSESGVAGLSSTLSDVYVKNTSGNASTLTLDGSGSYSFAGSIQNNIALVKNGSGTQVFNGNNTYTGGTTINGGVLQVDVNGTLGTGNVVNNASLYTSRSSIAAIFSDGSTSHTITGGIVDYTGNGTLTIDNTAAAQLVNTNVFGVRNTNGTVNITGNLTLVDTLQAIYGTLNVNDGAVVHARSLKMGDYSNYTTSTININDGATVELSDSSTAISNQAGIIVGHWPNAEGGVGILNVNGGSLTMLNSHIEVSWDGNGIMNVSGGEVNVKGILLVDHREAITTREFNLTGGTVNLGSEGLRFVTNDNVQLSESGFGGNGIHLGAGTLGALEAWSSIANMTLTDAATGTTFDAGYDITLSGLLSGEGKLNKTGDATLLLSGANTFAGGTDIAGGTLKLGAENAISTLENGAALNMTGGTLDMAGFNQELNTLNGTAGTITSSGSTLYANAGEFAGVIQDTVALTKDTDDTLILSGINTYTGQTTVSAGILQLSGSGEITVSDYDIASGAELQYNNAADENKEATNFFAGSGIIRKQNENTLLLSGTQANTFDGEIWVNGGTLQVASSFAEAYGYVDGCTLELLPNGVLKNVTVQKGNVVVDGGSVTDTLTIEDTSSDDDPSVVKSGSVENAVVTLGELDVEGGSVNTADVSEDGKLVVSNNGEVTTLDQTGGEASIEGGTVTTANLTDGETTVSGGTVATANVSENGDLTVRDNGAVTTLEQTGGEANVEGGTVATANLSDGKTTVSGGEVQQANVDNYGDLTVSDGSVAELNQDGGFASVEGGEVTVANLTDGETTVSGGTVATANLSDDGELTVKDDGVVTTLEQTDGNAYVEGGEVVTANLSQYGELNVSGGTVDTLNQDGGEANVEGGEVTEANLESGNLSVSDTGEISTLNQAGGTSNIYGGEVTAANLSSGDLNVSDDGFVETLTQTGGYSTITGGEVELADLQSGNLTVSGDGAVTTLNQSGGDSEISGGEVEEANLSGGNLTVSEDGYLESLTQTDGLSDITGGSVDEMDLQGGSSYIEGKGKVKDATMSGDDTVLTLYSKGELETLEQTAGTTNVDGGKITKSVDLSGDNSQLNVSGGSVKTVNQDSGTTNLSGGSIATLNLDSGTVNVTDGFLGYLSQEDGTTNISGGEVDSIDQFGGNIAVTDGYVYEAYQLGGTMTISDYGSVEYLETDGGLTISDDGWVEELHQYAGDVLIQGGTVEDYTIEDEEIAGGNLTIENGEVGVLTQKAGSTTIQNGTLGTVSLRNGELTMENGEVTDSLEVAAGVAEISGGDLNEIVVSGANGNLTLLDDNTVGTLAVDKGNVVLAGTTIDVLDISGGSVTTDDILDDILDNIAIGDVSMDGGYLSLVEVDDVGSLNLNRGATLEMLLKDEVDLAAVTTDKVDLNGGSLVVNMLDGQSFKAGDTYKLFSAANGITGDAVDDMSKLTQVIIQTVDGSKRMVFNSGMLPSLLQVTDNNTVLQFYVDPNIVPEPGTWMLLALGLLGLGVVSRRKRAKAA